MIRADRVLLRKYLTTKIPCSMNKRAIAFEESAESVTVKFEDGTRATGTMLVGADGANSNSKWKPGHGNHSPFRTFTFQTI